MSAPKEKTQKTFIAEVHNSGLKVRLTVGKEELDLDAAELDTVIRELAHRRSMLADVVPVDLEPNANFNPLINPKTLIGDTVIGEKAGQQKMALIAYRHPGLGWQSMVYSKEAARGMLEGFEKVVKKIDPLNTAGSGLILPKT